MKTFVLVATLAASTPALLGAGDADAVAEVAGAPVSAAELQRAIGDRLIRVETEEWNARLEFLDQLIEDRLLARESETRGVSVEELLRAEVQAKAAPVTEAEVSKAFEGVKARYKDTSEAELRVAIERSLEQQRERERRAEFVGGLRRAAGVRVLMEPPRAAVRTDGAPSRGPAAAPVTIVEFSDFQCPYCGRVQPVIGQLMQHYGDRLRVVFRHYPLPIHPLAPKAAEAAVCAADQGRFWEMHDKLFSDQAKLQVQDLKAKAAEVGLDAEAFGACLDAGRHEAAWRADRAEGDRIGVTGTPAFFVNGRYINGSQPYDVFAAIVDDELARARLPK